MRSDKHVFFSALTVVLLAILVCFRFFGDVMLHPGEFLFGDEGDGLKNYFAVAYQVIHGEGMWFNGMLYPYGDHLIFADGQPLLTKVLSWSVGRDVNNGTQIIGIMNLLMIGSLVVTAWCIHRLLTWNLVNPWFAVPFSLTIAFLSPQVARFIGHYALGYTFFVPMAWLLIAGFSRTHWPWVLALVTSGIVLLFGFLHPYYLFIFVIFLGSVVGWELLIKKFRLKDVEHLAARVFALIVPLVVFMAYQKGVDPITDRPTNPTGIFSYMTTFQSVFVPVVDPFRSLFNSYFFRIFIPGNWEGNAYIGMVASFTAFASVLALLRRSLKRRWKVLTHPVLPEPLRAAFIPAIITLLFAMGLFHLLGLHWLSDFIAPLKQFRSLGRVAWIFYYVFSVWTVYHLYVLFRHFRSVGKGKYTYHISVVVGLCAFLWMLDAIVNIKFHKAEMMNRNAKEAFSDHYVSQWRSAGVQIEDHQAIVPLPFMLVGSEKIGLESGPISLIHAMKGSFSSGLPIIGGTMSRTSLQVTERSAQLVSHPAFPRPILDELKQDKNLLLLCSNEALSEEEQRLLSNAELVFETEGYKLYSTDIFKLRALYEPFASVADSVAFAASGMYQAPSESAPSDELLWGDKSFAVSKPDHILDTVFADSEERILSYWVLLDPDAELIPTRSYAIAGERLFSGGMGKNANLLDGWLFMSDQLKAEAGKRHEYRINSRAGVVSRIQLRKATEEIIHREGTQVFVNNIPIDKHD